MCASWESWVAKWMASLWPAERAFPFRCGVTKRRDGISHNKKEFSRAVLLLLFFFFGFCLFVCFKTLLMHTTTWHQYPALPRTNEMTTGPIMVPDGNKRNSPLVNCWFSLYSGLPLSSQTSFNLENVSNQWWAPGWGS